MGQRVSKNLIAAKTLSGFKNAGCSKSMKKYLWLPELHGGAYIYIERVNFYIVLVLSMSL